MSPGTRVPPVPPRRLMLVAVLAMACVGCAEGLGEVAANKILRLSTHDLCFDEAGGFPQTLGPIELHLTPPDNGLEWIDKDEDRWVTITPELNTQGVPVTLTDRAGNPLEWNKPYVLEEEVSDVQTLLSVRVILGERTGPVSISIVVRAWVGRFLLLSGESRRRFLDVPLAYGTHWVSVEPCGSAPAPPASRILYVDDDTTAGGDGSSWGGAFPRLQDALAAAAVPGSGVGEIRVAVGRYHPDAGSRDATFLVPSGVAVRGGFLGNGSPDPNSRVLSGGLVFHGDGGSGSAFTETILDGDLQEDDGSPLSRADNSLHVVTIMQGADGVVLEGLRIHGGNADGPGGRGGGIVTDGGSLTIRECALHRCYAEVEGGAILAGQADVQVFDTIVRDCGGGAIRIDGGNLVFARGVLRFTQSRPAVDATGGAVVRISHALFDDGEAGALRLGPGVDAKVLNCVIARHGLFTGPSGAAIDASGATVLVVNATVDGNGILARDGAAVAVANSILFTGPNTGIGPPYLERDGTSSVTIHHSIVEGLADLEGIADLGSLSDADPRIDEQWRLDPASPAIDAGDPVALAAAYAGESALVGLADIDRFGNPRVDEPDLGAQEG